MAAATALAAGTRRMNLCSAITSALKVAMDVDPSMVVFGEDVGFGGVFRCTAGLQVGSRYGVRADGQNMMQIGRVAQRSRKHMENTGYSIPPCVNKESRGLE